MGCVQGFIVDNVQGPPLVGRQGAPRDLLRVPAGGQLVLHEAHLLHQHAHRLQEGALGADRVVGKEVLVAQARALVRLDAQQLQRLDKDGVVRFEDVVQVGVSEAAAGGGQQQEGQVLGGRGQLGVLPVEDDALELGLTALLPHHLGKQHVLLPQLAVDDG